MQRPLQYATVAAALGTLALVGLTDAQAQSCDPGCPPGGRNARGVPCCAAKAPPPAGRPAPAPPPAACPPGKSTGPDTAGRCCWPGQAWSGSACVGRPTQCPDGFIVDPAADECMIPSCPAGKDRPANSPTACCWPGQAWSSSQRSCIGKVSHCARGFDIAPSGDECTSDDIDQDGIKNAKDKCPELAEDKDRFEDEDGCPDNDNDQDGVHDARDRCKTQAEDQNGFEDGDGCPDEEKRVAGLAAAAEQARLAAEAEAREREERLQREREEQERQRAEQERLRREAEERASGPRFFDADGKYVIGMNVQYWPTFDGVSVGFDYHTGVGPMVFGINPQVGNLSFGGEPSAHARGTIGAEVVSWPNWRGSTFSFVNVDFGAVGGVQYMTDAVGTIGPYLRQKIKLGPIALHVMWEHVWLSDTFEDNRIGLGIGYAGVHDGKSEVVK